MSIKGIWRFIEADGFYGQLWFVWLVVTMSALGFGVFGLIDGPPTSNRAASALLVLLGCGSAMALRRFSRRVRRRLRAEE